MEIIFVSILEIFAYLSPVENQLTPVNLISFIFLRWILWI